MTTIARTTNTIESVPWTNVLRTTASIASTEPAVPNDVSPAASASLNALWLAQYPTAGTGEKIFSIDAQMVMTAVNASGAATIHSQRW
ncbi:Uncharacterised protein [Mycobacteroides abscessus]|nr:Uncharacterised protein [Mycobacteroides abscessus]